MRKKKIVIIIASVLIFVGTSVYFATTNIKGENTQELVNRQREYEVTRGNLEAGINGSGILKFESVLHNFSQSVTIDKLYVKEGQNVAEGDRLASLSVDEIQKKINELNSELKRSSAELEQIKATPGYSKNSSDLVKLEIDKLNKEISNLRKLKDSPILYSKVSGVVMALGYTEKATTTPDNPIVTVGDSSKVFAEIVVSQNDINSIKEGQIVTLEVAAFQDEKISGKVSYVNLKPNTEGNSTTYKAIVDVESKEYRLLEGMTTNAHLILKDVKDSLILSNKAIKFKDGKQVVKVKNEDASLNEVTIQTGFSDGKNSEILSGLKEGDIVVVGG